MTPKTIRRVLVAGIATAYAVGAFCATASQSPVDKALFTLNPDAKITSNTPSPMAGYRQVIADGQVLFISDDGRFVVQGRVFDVNRRNELTEVAMAAVRADVLRSAPIKDMIVYSPAKPKYTVTVFTDPSCGFCRAMHENMQSYLDAGIAIRYMPYPRSGTASADGDKARAVWCAADRKAAMSQAFKGNDPTPVAAGQCSALVEAGHALGTQLSIPGTPAVIAANGDLLGGMVTAPKMLAALEAIDAQAAK